MRMLKTAALCLILVVACAACIAPASTAFAATKTIHTTTAVENKAYKRCLNVAMSYKKHPQSVTVDLSDLRLTDKQAKNVEDLLWGNGELWWIDVFGLNPTAESITITFKYDDAKIDAMRKKFEAAVKVAMKRVSPGMSGDTKVHMLHDYIIRAIKYKDKAKDAYSALVGKKADCFGYTLVTDVLMRRAGFQTDVAWTSESASDHSWNLVRVAGRWYHVDTTWDRFYTYSLDSYTKAKEVCHVYLLQPDRVMAYDDHIGWHAHHACNSRKYEEYVYLGGTFTEHCKDYKKAVRSFTKGGLTFTVTAPKKVSVSSVAKSYRSKTSLDIPARVTYRGVSYAVNGISAKAFAYSSAKTLVVAAKGFSEARVKDSLLASKVKVLKVPKEKVAAYKKCFSKGNCGKKVRVSAASGTPFRSASLRAA